MVTIISWPLGLPCIGEVGENDIRGESKEEIEESGCGSVFLFPHVIVIENHGEDMSGFKKTHDCVALAISSCQDRQSIIAHQAQDNHACGDSEYSPYDTGLRSNV